MITLPRFASSALRLSNTAYADFGNPPILSALKTFTLEAWVYPQNVTQSQTIIGKRNLNTSGSEGQYQLFIQDGKVNAWYPPAYYLAADVEIKVGQWWHLAVVYDEITQTLAIYINGEFAAKSQPPFVQPTYSPDLLVGAVLNNGVPHDFFQGLIGEVMIWDEARSAEDILNDSVQISYQGDTAVPSLLLDYDCTTLPAADWSGNNLKATLLQGANYSLTIPGVHLQNKAYVNCGSNADLSLDGTKPYTIEGWFYPTSSASGTLIGKWNSNVIGEYAVLYQDNQVASLRDVAPWTLATSASITPNSYYHFATTYDEHTNVLNLYINGNLQSSLYFPATPNCAMDVLIGASYSAGTPANFFQGYIQNIRVWNVCLEQDEILQWMYNQPVSDPTLIASFDFSVNPPVDTTDKHSIQLINGAKIDALILPVTPDSTEGRLGFIQSINADYFNRNEEAPVAPPQQTTASTKKASVEFITPFTEQYKADTWREIENRIRQSGASGERIEQARQDFESAYQKASELVKNNPNLLKVFTIKDENGMRSVTYHGISGDMTFLTVPSVSLDTCTTWWISFDFLITVGFFQALGLLPTVGNIATRVYNMLTRNEDVATALLALAGAAITLPQALDLMYLIYQQGLLWSILKMLFTSAGWWTLAWILQKTFELCTGLETAVLMTGMLIWAAQLATTSLNYSTACGVTEQLVEAAPTAAAIA